MGTRSLALAQEAPSKSRLVENPAQEPILSAFKAWLSMRLAQGATYSELHQETQLAVPELMALVEPDLDLDESDMIRHREAIGKRTGLAFKQIRADAPDYRLTPP